MKRDISYENWIYSVGLVLKHRKSSDYVHEEWEHTTQGKEYWEGLEKIYEEYIQSQQKEDNEK